MQISCPGCKTRINVPDDKIKPTGTKVKCGKCAKVFTVKKKPSDSAEGTPPSAPTPPPPPPPAPPEENLFGEDPFGGDLADNFKTQVRPVGGDRGSDLFGSAGDLSPTPAARAGQAKAAADDVDSLFGSSDDMGGDLGAPDPDTEGPPPDEDDGLDSFVDNIRSTRADRLEEEAPPSAPSAAPPGGESLDDLFGKGLDSDSDDFATQLFERPKKPAKQPSPAQPAATVAPPKAKAAAPKPAADDLDDLFGRDDEPEPPARKAHPTPPEPPAPSPADRLESLFSDDDDAPPAPPPRKAAATAAEPATLATRGPSAEELAASMDLEPALKEEDAPKALPKAPKAKASEPKRPFPVKAFVWVLVLMLLAGAGGAVVFVPAVKAPVMSLIKTVPIDKLLAFLPSEKGPPPAPPITLTVNVNRSRMLTGGRGDHFYIVEGTVTNAYAGPRSFIKLRGELSNEAGEIVSQREVFAGNILNDEEIRGLDRVRIDGILNRSVGGGLTNFNVPPGNAIPFQIIFYDADPAIAVTPAVKPVNSEPGSGS